MEPISWIILFTVAWWGAGKVEQAIWGDAGPIVRPINQGVRGGVNGVRTGVRERGGRTGRPVRTGGGVHSTGPGNVIDGEEEEPRSWVHNGGGRTGRGVGYGVAITGGAISRGVREGRDGWRRGRDVHREWLRRRREERERQRTGEPRTTGGQPPIQPAQPPAQPPPVWGTPDPTQPPPGTQPDDVGCCEKCGGHFTWSTYQTHDCPGEKGSTTTDPSTGGDMPPTADIGIKIPSVIDDHETLRRILNQLRTGGNGTLDNVRRQIRQLRSMLERFRQFCEAIRSLRGRCTNNIGEDTKAALTPVEESAAQAARAIQSALEQLASIEKTLKPIGDAASVAHKQTTAARG
jgi:hypothetical protein